MAYNDYDEENYDFDNMLYGIRTDRYCVKRFVAYMQEKANNLPNGDEKKHDYEKRIRRIADTNKVTNADIAAIFNGMALSTVNGWVGESKKASIPSAIYLPKLAKAFGVSTDYLLGLVPEYENANVSDYPILRQFGIDVDVFQKTYELKCKELGQLNDVLDALELLLSQENSPFSILTAIGQYLNIENDKTCTYYDLKDFLDFKAQLSTALELHPEELPTCVDNFINVQRKPITTCTISQGKLENIVSNLYKYKEELDNEE